MSKNKHLKGGILGSSDYSDHDYSNPEESRLGRGLSNRHIQLISIGGAIGSGLFMGSGKTISLSGVSVIFTYMIIGFFLFMVMRAMGELLLSNLNYKSFVDFSTAYLGLWAGFFIGWSYWLSCVISAVADFVVISGYMQFWYPGLSLWIPSVLILVVLLGFNLLSVKLFGELEFWFASIKVAAIVGLIATGIWMISTSYVSPDGVHASLSHLTASGTFMPHGIMGFFAGFQIAIFAFAGVELIGTTAAETKDPEKTLPRAINSVPVRILLFYVLTISVVIAVSSVQHISPGQSPFVQLFVMAGLPAAASILNFVVTTSAASAANSCIFSTSRMLYGLASEKDAPAIFKKLARSFVPMNSLLFCCLCMFIGIALLFIFPDIMTVFTLVSTIAAILFIFTWSMILASYLVYRKNRPELHEKSTYKMPAGIAMSWATLAFFAFVIGLLFLEKDTRLALFYTPVWFIGLCVAYKVRARSERYKILSSGVRTEFN